MSPLTKEPREGTADACDEGQKRPGPRWCRQCWGHLEKGRGEKMLSPTLPRPEQFARQR